jgi:hypothetical protein
VLLITLIGGVGERAGGFRLTTSDEARTAGGGYRILARNRRKLGLGLTCVRVRLRPRGFSGGSVEAEGADEGGTEPGAN